MGIGEEKSARITSQVTEIYLVRTLHAAKEFRVDVSKPREPHLSECPTLVQSTEYKRKRRNDKNTRAMQRTTPCTSPGLSSVATARRCNKREQKQKGK